MLKFRIGIERYGVKEGETDRVFTEIPFIDANKGDFDEYDLDEAAILAQLFVGVWLSTLFTFPTFMLNGGC